MVKSIYEATKGDATIVTGVGQNQMWAAQYYTYNRPNTFISSGGLGTMGFGLPASVGVKIGLPDATGLVHRWRRQFPDDPARTGDHPPGKVAVKIAIMNNGYLGMVRQWQEIFQSKRYVATPLWGPDFVKLAEAYGIAGGR